MASTVLPNGIIIPEKYSRDWYNDLYHNWEELDNLLSASSRPGDGTLTIQKNGTDLGTFSANQSTDETVNITVPTDTNELTNGAGFITADYAVPRSGGAVMTGGLGYFTSSEIFSIFGGTSMATNAKIDLYGENSYGTPGYLMLHAAQGTSRQIVVLAPWGAFYPDYDNTCSLGAGGQRWEEVYAATGTINTSDSRLKNSVKDIDDKLLDAWENIEPKQYKFNDATEKKGKQARYHTGYLAQDIQAECEKQGINASDYGLFCYDEWDEQEEVSEEIETEKDGKKVKEKHVIRPRREKGDTYALRYEEALVVECKYLRRCIAQLATRIEQLEKGIMLNNV